MATAILIAPPSPQNQSGPTPSADTAISIALPPSPYQAVPAPPTGTPNSIDSPPPPSVPTRIGPTDGHRNLYCNAPPQDQPVSAPPMGIAISIVPPPPSVSACTGATSGYGNLYCPAPPQYRPAATSPTAAQTRLPVLSGFQWSNYFNNQGSQGSSSHQLTSPLRSRTPFHSNHHCRLHDPAPLQSE